MMRCTDLPDLRTANECPTLARIRTTATDPPQEDGIPALVVLAT